MLYKNRFGVEVERWFSTQKIQRHFHWPPMTAKMMDSQQYYTSRRNGPTNVTIEGLFDKRHVQTFQTNKKLTFRTTPLSTELKLLVPVNQTSYVQGLFTFKKKIPSTTIYFCRTKSILTNPEVNGWRSAYFRICTAHHII